MEIFANQRRGNKEGNYRPGFQVPQLLYPENTNPDVLILQKEYAWHIAGGLSQMETEKWNLLYHSAIYGRSFTTFMGIISRVKGPTILVVKDIGGYIHEGMPLSHGRDMRYEARELKKVGRWAKGERRVARLLEERK
ncbi:hypothetical protein HPP92_023055 [Vanilla planifolia]|uniref:TLDc domain-containing protein n=1 Tax=Vanilla planifolia TaxID=51239 RepID=A0A835UE41_VANPL|nr:hypothetical protein HPP92_023055 [Vanilla planifolia]